MCVYVALNRYCSKLSEENAFEFSGIHFQFIKIVKAAGVILDIYLYASKTSLNICSIGTMH